MLSDEEKEQYSRQVLIPGWDQERLKQATALIVGLGGLGSASALYLAAAGIGRLRLCDGDTVGRSDLNRQTLYSEASIGLPKVDEAGRRIKALNPSVAVEKFNFFADSQNAGKLAESCQVIVDGLDNLESRFVLNQESFKQRIPFVYGAVHGWLGYAGLFHAPHTACLACLMHADLVSRDRVPVAGITPGTIGLIQANEVIKWILGRSSSLRGRILIYDGAELSFKIVSVAKNPICPVCSKP